MIMAASKSCSCEFGTLLHDIPRSQFLSRYEAGARVQLSQPEGASKKFYDQLPKLIYDPRNLKAAWDHVAAKGSVGAGPDGRSPRDFSRQESWDLIGQLSRELQAEQYQHGPFRRVQIPKPGSKQKRTIWIANVADRIVARGTAQILAPLLEHAIPGTLFCRRGYGRMRAIATAKLLTERSDATTWIVQDLRDAYPSVPRRRLLDLVRKQVRNDRVVRLVAALIMQAGQQGIPTGSSIAALLLSCYVDHTIHRPWRKRHPEIQMLSYLDDFLLLPRASDSLATVQSDFAQFATSAGFRLKFTDAEAATDLARDDSHWLGYRVRQRAESIQISVPWVEQPDAIRGRYLPHFVELHRQPDAVFLAPQAIKQILSQAAPAFTQPTAAQAVESLLETAAEAGFEECPSAADYMAFWGGRFAHWQQYERTVTDLLWPPERRGGKPEGRCIIYVAACYLSDEPAGGWAFRVLRQGKLQVAMRGGVGRSSIQRLQLLGLVRALREVAGPAELRVVTDSGYLANGIKQLEAWHANAWRRSDGQPLKNADLWQQVYDLCLTHTLTVKWRRDRSGSPILQDCYEHAWHIAGM